MKDTAQSIIDTVHALWEKKRNIYKDGYAVFYSAPHLRPDLMLIGMNPGGDVGSFSHRKEEVMSPADEMSYLRYRIDPTYPLAGKTSSLFESIGMLDVLRASLKTNLNFFRSGDRASLPQEGADEQECERIVVKMIQDFQPRIVLCEALEVFDRLHSLMRERFPSSPQNKVDGERMRLYVSVASNTRGRPQLLAGYPHLTGKNRLSDADLERIKAPLRDDLSKLLLPEE